MTSPSSHAPTSGERAISASVEYLMAAHDENVRDLSYFTRLSPASIYRKINGERPWRVSDLELLCEHYGVTANDLLSGNPPAPPTVR